MQLSSKLLIYFIFLMTERFSRTEAQFDKISYVMQQKQGKLNAEQSVDKTVEYFIDHEWSEKEARDYLRGISHERINCKYLNFHS